MMDELQRNFDLTIGRTDRILSEMMSLGRAAKDRIRIGESAAACTTSAQTVMDEPNRQTLKHHAEDMIACGNAILRLLGKSQEGTPQPETK